MADPHTTDQGRLQFLTLDEIQWKMSELQKEIDRRKSNGQDEAFRQLQNSLINYDFQKCPRIKKESFRDLYVGDIDVVRIAFIGPTGSGMTSLIGTLQRALGEDQRIFGVGMGRQDTYRVEEFYLQKQIRLVDTPGFFSFDDSEIDDVVRQCLDIMSGRIRSGEIVREFYAQGKGKMTKGRRTKRVYELSKCAHAVVFVLRANDHRLKFGEYDRKLRKIREHLREEGYAPVTAITHEDRIKFHEDKETAFYMAMSAMGSSSDKTHFIANDTYETFKRNEKSSVVNRAALEILDSALISAERFIQIRKQREQSQLEREFAAAVSEGTRNGVETVEQFFARLKKKHKWNDQGKVKEVLSELHSKEIRTVNVLMEVWEDVKLLLPLSIGMKRCIEEEITIMSLGIGNVFDFTASSSTPIIS